MDPFIKAWMRVLVPALMLVLLAGPARAADLNKYLPDDTGLVLGVNFRQTLEAPLVKKHALELIQKTIKDSLDATKVFDALGLEPLKDIDQAIIAGTDLAENGKGLIIVTGRFDAAKIKAKAAEIAKNQPDALQLLPAGGSEIYEVKLPDQPGPFFVAVADKNTMLGSPSKEYVLDALDKAAGKKKTELKNKTIGLMVGRADATQCAWLAVGGNTLEKGIPFGMEEGVKQFLGKCEALSGGVKITDDIKAEFVIDAKDAKGAKELNQFIGDGINQGLGILAILAANQKELAPLVDVAKGIKTTFKDKAVTITVTVPGELVEKALKMAQ